MQASPQLEIQEIALDKIVFREDLYPRIEKSPVTVQKYAEDLDVLPPIEVNQHFELIDGWHRWTAHKKCEAVMIRVIVTPTANEAEFLELAIERNATHGLQLTQADKEKMAGRLYSAFLRARHTAEECEGYKLRLVKILGSSPRSVRRWTSRDDKDFERDIENEVFARWLACESQEAIAEIIGWSQPKVAEFIRNGQMAICDKSDSPEYTRAHHTDESFQRPIYNIWKQQDKTPGVSHFGNSEIRWLDNLLYLYTSPFDVVVDPFAGSGSTIDLCKKRLRRYYVSDRKPVVEREDIRMHDLTTGLPELPQWKDVRLVYLDPPYWKQAEGKYSEDPEDLANMSLEQFHKTLTGIVKAFAKKLKPGAAVALIISPTQYAAPEHQYTDHIAAMLREVALPLDMRFSAPYESQQYNAQMVEWAKANRRCLVLTREIVVWRTV